MIGVLRTDNDMIASPEAQDLIGSQRHFELVSEDSFFADEPVLVVSSKDPQWRRRVALLLTGLCILGVTVGLLMFHRFRNDSGDLLSDESQDKPQWMPTADNDAMLTTTQATANAPEATTTTATTMMATTIATVPTTTATLPSDPIKYYTVARSDRDGAAIKEMLLVHDWAFTNHKTYAGACVDAIDWKALAKRHSDHFVQTVKDRIPGRIKLVQVLGLQDELPFACPSSQDLDAGRAKFIKRSDFKGAPLSTRWIDYLKSKATFDYGEKDPAAPKQVVVHVRRGDFTPCHVPDRYMPNIYYLEVLDYYLPKYCNDTPCNVTIFSESDSYETFDPFLEHNYTIDFESGSAEIWQAIARADVFIMSESSFSFVPATLNQGTVLTPYYDVEPWEEIPDFIYRDAMRKRNEQQEHCR
mmetsp:Transcript_15834/g.29931  ORF Transcript_15834/g.29931 Transcript_15834/m.29931 type:complete len:414 (-) Transcript_15834:1380-2621(-)|eukprot:scaffold3134_cov182-Amphora_coffeaeformis.AAC.16